MASVVNKYYSLGSGNWARLVLRITQISQSIANNTSQVKVQLIWQKLQSDGNSTSIGAREDTKITADGTTVTKTASALNTTSGEKVIAEHTFTVSHASTGKKTASVSVSYPMQGTIQGTYYGTVNISSSITLDTIPRASVLKAFSFKTPIKSGGQGTISLDIERKNNDFTNTVSLKDGETTVMSWSDVTTEKELTIWSNYITDIISIMGPSLTKTFTLSVQTRYDGRNIGNPSTRTATASRPGRSTLKNAEFAGALEVSEGKIINIDVDVADSQYKHRFRIYDGSYELGYWEPSALNSLNFYSNNVNDLLSRMPNHISKTLTLGMQTMLLDMSVGTEHRVNLTATLHENVKPSVGALSVEDMQSVAKGLGVGYIQGISQLRGTVASVSARGGATIKSRTWVFDGQTGTSTGLTSPTFNPSTKTSGLRISHTVTDSRNRSTTVQSVAFGQLAYSRPTINKFEAKRYDEANPDKVNFDLSATRTGLSDKNTLRYKITKQKVGTSAISDHKAWTGPTASNINLSATVMPDLINDGEYLLTVEVEDKFTKTLRAFALRGTRHRWRRIIDGRRAEYNLPNGMVVNGRAVFGSDDFFYRGHVSDLNDISNLGSGIYHGSDNLENADGFYKYDPFILIRRFGGSGPGIWIGSNSAGTGLFYKRVSG